MDFILCLKITRRIIGTIAYHQLYNVNPLLYIQTSSNTVLLKTGADYHTVLRDRCAMRNISDEKSCLFTRSGAIRAFSNCSVSGGSSALGDASAVSAPPPPLQRRDGGLKCTARSGSIAIATPVPGIGYFKRIAYRGFGLSSSCSGSVTF